MNPARRKENTRDRESGNQENRPRTGGLIGKEKKTRDHVKRRSTRGTCCMAGLKESQEEWGTGLGMAGKGQEGKGKRRGGRASTSYPALAVSLARSLDADGWGERPARYPVVWGCLSSHWAGGGAPPARVTHLDRNRGRFAPARAKVPSSDVGYEGTYLRRCCCWSVCAVEQPARREAKVPPR